MSRPDLGPIPVVERVQSHTARARRADDRAEAISNLLWLYSLGIVLFWVHDTSAGCAKTYRLIDATVPLADRLVTLSRLPVLRGTMREVIAIIQEIRG